jgi:hypothetical protein
VVHAAEPFEEAGDVLFPADVGHGRVRLTAGGLRQFGPGRRQALRGPAGDHDVVVLGEQGAGQGQADAGTAADDQCVRHGIQAGGGGPAAGRPRCSGVRYGHPPRGPPVADSFG